MNHNDNGTSYPALVQMREEVIAGLRQPNKKLAAKFNYDEKGAKLYEEIGRTADYYLTRLDTAILCNQIDAIVPHLSDALLLVEYGSGNSQKTRILLDHLPNVVGYIPIEIAEQQLFETAESLKKAYPDIEIMPVHADFSHPITLPRPTRAYDRKLFFYPGSTIGNVSPEDATAFLRRKRAQASVGDGLLISVDLIKSAEILERAYDDSEGVTRDFNLFNVVTRLNRAFDANFVASHFVHRAKYDPVNHRVDIFWESLRDQCIRMGDEEIFIARGEQIDRAVAYKYDLSLFAQLVEAAGWAFKEAWCDEKEWFSVQYFVAV